MQDGVFKSDQEINIIPSEKILIKQAIMAESDSNETRNAFHFKETVKDLQDAVDGFAMRLMNRIAEIGFSSFVSNDMKNPDNWDMYEDGSMIWRPEVRIKDRLKGSSEIDHDKKAYEVRHGFEDGRIGRMIGGNTWTQDPDSKLFL
jgi:hypothetical protein